MCDLLQSFQVWSDLDEANPGHVNASDDSRTRHSGDGTRIDASRGTRQSKPRREYGSNILLRVLLPAPKHKAQ